MDGRCFRFYSGGSSRKGISENSEVPESFLGRGVWDTKVTDQVFFFLILKQNSSKGKEVNAD